MKQHILVTVALFLLATQENRVMGYAANCQNKASYSSIVERILSRKFDEYRDLKFSEERLRLDQFTIAIHNEPGSKGYIVIYDAIDSRKSSVRERGERAKKYLMKERGIPQNADSNCEWRP